MSGFGPSIKYPSVCTSITPRKLHVYDLPPCPFQPGPGRMAPQKAGKSNSPCAIKEGVTQDCIITIHGHRNGAGHGAGLDPERARDTQRSEDLPQRRRKLQTHISAKAPWPQEEGMAHVVVTSYCPEKAVRTKMPHTSSVPWSSMFFLVLLKISM